MIYDSCVKHEVWLKFDVVEGFLVSAEAFAYMLTPTKHPKTTSNDNLTSCFMQES